MKSTVQAPRAGSGIGPASAWLLGAGAVLVFFTFMLFSLAPAGWIAFAPWLV